MSAIAGARTAALVLLSGLLAPCGWAEDCSRRFPVGRYGVSPTDPGLAEIPIDGLEFLRLEKRVVEESPEVCDHVYVSDVFRLAPGRDPGLLVAGCRGDLDGDDSDDYALLMRSRTDGSIRPRVFLRRADGYADFVLDEVTDPYGFDEDPSVWPGPICLPRPRDGRFEPGFDEARPSVGEPIAVGWYTYLWDPEAGRFVALQTSD